LKNILTYFVVLILFVSCQANKSIIRDHVTIQVYPYEDGNEMKAAAMPAIKDDSELARYSRRFEYLLINISQIHLPEKSGERNKIFALYPDTVALKKQYLEKYVEDKNLRAYFEETLDPMTNPDVAITKIFTVDELMAVASRFFYCDLIEPDTNVQAHVCIGLNGIREASWVKDYTLLEAFCYEAIFDDFDQEVSPIWDSFVAEKGKACQKHRHAIISLDQYLEDVKLDLFERMQQDEILKNVLLNYYELNKNNLAFKIIRPV
jgi:hypothetical protein